MGAPILWESSELTQRPEVWPGLRNCFESERGPGFFVFHTAMVLFNYVVEVFTLPDFYHRAALGLISFDSRGISTALMDLDFRGSTVITNSLTQKA